MMMCVTRWGISMMPIVQKTEAQIADSLLYIGGTQLSPLAILYQLNSYHKLQLKFQLKRTSGTLSTMNHSNKLTTPMAIKTTPQDTPQSLSGLLGAQSPQQQKQQQKMQQKQPQQQHEAKKEQMQHAFSSLLSRHMYRPMF